LKYINQNLIFGVSAQEPAELDFRLSIQPEQGEGVSTQQPAELDFRIEYLVGFER
jgi:hypothetical protein